MASHIPLFFGLSGCVHAQTTSWPAFTIESRQAAAKYVVPMKSNFKRRQLPII
jgi:hypothetical protein